MEEKYVALIGLLLLKLGKYWTREQSNIDEAYFIDDEWDAFFSLSIVYNDKATLKIFQI